jgi:hypothetical protein
VGGVLNSVKDIAGSTVLAAGVKSAATGVTGAAVTSLVSDTSFNLVSVVGGVAGSMASSGLVSVNGSQQPFTVLGSADVGNAVLGGVSSGVNGGLIALLSDTSFDWAGVFAGMSTAVVQSLLQPRPDQTSQQEPSGEIVVTGIDDLWSLHDKGLLPDEFYLLRLPAVGTDDLWSLYDQGHLPNELFPVQEHRGVGYVNGEQVELKLAPIGDGKFLETEAACWFRVMQADAARAGVELIVNSAFRTWEEQKALRDYFEADTQRHTPADRPGFSTHQQGLSVDLKINGRPEVDAWLIANAQRYGFLRHTSAREYHHFTFTK